MNVGRKKTKLKSRHIFLCCFICLLFLTTLFFSQETKLKEIDVSQQALIAEHEKLLLEQRRLERMLEYAQTDEYREQYAREKLGYVWPEDYKFYREDVD